MFKLQCVLGLVALFVEFAHPWVSAAQVDPPPRSVKVALETSFLFDPKDITNESLADNIKGFLHKLYTILEPAQNQTSFRAEDEPQGNEGSPNFIEIIRSIGTHFVNISGGKIKEALNTIHGEVMKMTDDIKVQAKIKEMIPEEKMNAVTKISEERRRKINSTMTEEPIETVARKVNTYYNDEDVRILGKILKKIRRSFENVVDNSKVIKDLLPNATFKKYNSLNESDNGALLSDLKMLSNFPIAKNMFSGLNENLPVLTRRNSPTQEDDTAGFNEADITYTALRRSIDKKLKEAREKKEN